MSHFFFFLLIKRVAKKRNINRLFTAHAVYRLCFFVRRWGVSIFLYFFFTELLRVKSRNQIAKPSLGSSYIDDFFFVLQNHPVRNQLHATAVYRHPRATTKPLDFSVQENSVYIYTYTYIYI